MDCLKEDKRVSSLDHCNLKLVFNGFIEKAELKEKERLKEENRKLKKLEQNFRSLLKRLEISETTKYEDIKDKISNEDAYLSIYSDSEREKIFADYINQMQETCLHHIKKKKEKRKKSKRSRNDNEPLSDEFSDEDDSRAVSPKVSRRHNDKESGEISSSRHEKRDHHDERMEEESSHRFSDKSSKKHKKSKRKKKTKSVS